MAATAVAGARTRADALKAPAEHPPNCLTAFSGLIGSGKTTAAHKLKEQKPTAWLISRDEIRRSVFSGPGLFSEEEDTITAIMLCLGKLGLMAGFDVIIDDLNIFPDEKQRWNALATELGVPIRWRCIVTDVEECVRRDATRPHPVGREVIEQYAAAAGLP